MTRNELIEYVEHEKKTAPYMYINLKTFDPTNPELRLWIDFSEIRGGYLKYYDCLHFYTKDAINYPKEKLLSTIEKENPRVIMLQENIGYMVEQQLSGKYILERNYIIDMDAVGKQYDGIYESEIANKDTIPSIVDLLLTEEEYSIVYDRDTLLKQLLDRYESGISRYYVIKKHGMVVASCSSYGETEDLAIVGGVIVHKDFRRHGLAKDVEQHICTDLRNEGKSCISFVNYDNVPSLALQNKLGGIVYSTYYKFIRR